MIENQLMVINLSTSCYGGLKTDREASSKLALENDSNPRSAKVVKKLFGDCKSLQKIQTFSSSVRAELSDKTFPYHVRGAFLVPVGHAIEVISFLNKKRDEFFHMVDSFVKDEFDTVIEKSKQDLKGLWKDGDIPSKEEFRTHFDFRVDVDSIPDPDSLDQILGIEDILKEQKENMQTRIDEISNTLYSVSVNRLKESCEKIIERFSNFTGKKGGSFRKEIIIGAARVADNTLVSNEVIKSDRISDWCKTIKSCTDKDPEIYRLDPALRSQVCSDLKRILKEMEQ